MGNNGRTGQLVGPFTAHDELYFRIVNDAHINMLYVQHLGVQAEVGSLIYINGEAYEIGKTGIYEVGNTEITSIYFDKDTDDNTIIDYSIHRDE